MPAESSHLHNYVYSSEMVEFVTISNACCQFLEQLKGVDGKAFIEQSVQHLSGVYAAVVKLDETDPQIESAGESTVTEQEWSALFQRIAMLLGAHNDIVRQVEDEEFDRSDLVNHTISEDMADVYQELRDFTTIYSRGMEELMNDAAWELKERFAEHWGKKLLRSLMALHDLYIQGVDPTEKE
ncbi:MAG: DUF5063 domain-containing protein [Bacteroidota bacterium]